jgi:hypothetical protein
VLFKDQARRQIAGLEYQEPPREGWTSNIVRNLEDKLQDKLLNPEPVLYTEEGMKMIKNNHGESVPLKLIRFIKKGELSGKDGSFPEASPRSGRPANDVVYLADKFLLENYLIKEKQKTESKSSKKRFETGMKSGDLWPKKKVHKQPAFGMMMQKNSTHRLSQGVESVQHSLNYQTVKMHPKHLNYHQTPLSGRQKPETNVGSVTDRSKSILENSVLEKQVQKVEKNQDLKTLKLAESKGGKENVVVNARDTDQLKSMVKRACSEAWT